MTADVREDELRAMLRSWRKRLGVSQAELARLSGLGQNTLSRYERGERNLSSAARIRLERAIERVFDKREGEIIRAAQSPPKGLTPETAGRIREQVNKVLNSEDPNPAADALAKKLYEAYTEIQKQKEQIATMKGLIESQTKLLDKFQSVCTDALPELRQKDARIAELEKQVADLRALYEAETEAALAYDKARELRERVTGKGEE